MRGVCGTAPTACRRCGGTTLSVASEKYARVTRVCQNADCRQDFLGWLQAKYCGRCSPLFRGRAIWERRRKYLWTPPLDQIVRDTYVAGRKGAAQTLAVRFGWPKWAITHRVSALGLARTKELNWTPDEDAVLEEWAGVRSAHWMKQQPGLRHRTETAIVVRLKRLHISRRIQHDGLTMGQFEQALGVDHRQIAAWVRSGRLLSTRVKTDRLPQQCGDPYVFAAADITAFVLENPSLFRLDRVDQLWFMGLMREASGVARGSRD